MTALRGDMAKDAASVRPGVVRERWLVGAGLVGLVLFAVVLRLVPTVFAPSMNWGDEIFQTVEPAHRLVYGYGLVPWEFQLGLRSWLLPGALAGLIEAARLFGDGPAAYLPAIAVALGLVASAPLICVFLWCRRQIGLPAAFVAGIAVTVAPELVYFGARALNEVVAAHVLVVALYLSDPGGGARRSRRDFAAGALLGLMCVLRLQLVPAAAIVALWPSAGGWRRRFLTMLAGGVAALALGAAFDWATLGYPLASVWRNVYYNLYLHVSSGFSVEPWFFYLAGELGVWAAAVPFVLLLIGLGARRMPVLLGTAIVIVAVHSLIPHKEYRFIYPAIVLLMLLAAIGLAQLAQWVAAWLAGRGWRAGRAAAAASVVLAGFWCTLAYGAWSDGVIASLRQRAHDELIAMSFVRGLPGLCGVGLYGKNAWVRYGGYTWLHRPVPMFWPDSAAELAATAPAFDTLLYDTTEKTLPASLGFAPARCFGSICVVHRAGGCAALPPPAMWFPPEVRGMRPDAGRFLAVPPR